MRALRECRLYGIIDLGYIPRLRDCNRIAEQMVSGGVDLIQLRGKGKSIEELMNLGDKYGSVAKIFLAAGFRPCFGFSARLSG